MAPPHSITEKQVEITAWYVFYTVSRHEKKAAENLEKNGFKVFLPLITEIKQWSDRKKKIQSPLFRGYLFVRAVPSQIQTICGFPGIVNAVKNFGKYAQVDKEEIETIQLLIKSGIYAEAIPGNIAKGDLVMVSEGPLKGMSGKCIQESSQHYFFVEVPSVNHLIRIKIHASAIRKI